MNQSVVGNPMTGSMTMQATIPKQGLSPPNIFLQANFLQHLVDNSSPNLAQKNSLYETLLSNLIVVINNDWLYI